MSLIHCFNLLLSNNSSNSNSKRVENYCFTLHNSCEQQPTTVHVPCIKRTHFFNSSISSILTTTLLIVLFVINFSIFISCSSGYYGNYGNNEERLCLPKGNKPSFEQDICSENVNNNSGFTSKNNPLSKYFPIILPSWCQYHNPFTTPLLFSDRGLDLTEDPICLNSNNNDSDDDLQEEKCTVVQKVKLIEFDPIELPFINATIPGQTYQLTPRYVIFVTNNGEIYYIINNKRFRFGLVNNDKILSLDTINNGTNGYILLSDKRGDLNLYCLNLMGSLNTASIVMLNDSVSVIVNQNGNYNDGNNGRREMLVTTKQFTLFDDGTVVETFSSPNYPNSTNDGRKIYAVSLVKIIIDNTLQNNLKNNLKNNLQKDLQQEEYYELRFSKIELCSIQVNLFKYKIKNIFGNHLKFDIEKQFTNITMKSPFDVRNDETIYERTLIQIYDEKSIKIIQFIERDIDYIDFNNDKDEYIMFKVKDNSQIITSSKLLNERLRRNYFLNETLNCDSNNNNLFNFSNSDENAFFWENKKIEVKPSQEMYLLITTHDKEKDKNELIIQHLPEFSVTTFPRNVHQITTVGSENSANPTVRKLPMSNDCLVTSDKYFVKDTCISAYQTILPLNAKAKSIKFRFIDIPIQMKQAFPGLGSKLDKIQEPSPNAIGGNSGEVKRPSIQNNEFIEAFCRFKTSDGSSNLDLTKFSDCLKNTNISTFDGCHLQNLMSTQTNLVKELMKDYWLNQIYISFENRQIQTFGAQITLCDPSSTNYIVKPFNTLKLIGDIQDFEVSLNGQHLYAPISRNKWELNSIQRYKEICEKLKQDPNNIFLESFYDQCEKEQPRNVDLNQFVMYMGSCFSGIFCPSFRFNMISSPPSGYYTQNPTYLTKCPKGSFCVMGQKRYCPIGFICDTVGLSQPKRCKDSAIQTCYGEGHWKPDICPHGTRCIAPYFPPLPISPGLFVEETNYEIDKQPNAYTCQLGDWCPIGRSAPRNVTNGGALIVKSLKCPANTVCNTTSVLTPTICSCNEKSCSYCPEGTFIERPCPSGSYCTRPDEIYKCHKGQYCPEGTIVPLNCPAGFYCETPKNKTICPSGYYCPEGSKFPVKCSVLSFCDEGGNHETFNFLSLVLIAAVAIIFFLLFQTYGYLRRKWNEFVDKKKKRERLQNVKRMTRDHSFKMMNNNNLSNINTEALLNSEMIELDKETESYYLNMEMNEAFFSQETRPSIDIKFEELSLELKQEGGKKVLNGVTGELKHGRVCAVMGPSGCGKSSFLTTLSGRAYYGKRNGKVYLNGVEDDLNRYDSFVAFVPQDDIMHPVFTVKETIYFSARTRLPRSRSRGDVNKLVDYVINVLGLEEIKHTIIGDEKKRGISGGQKKRVNCAMEIVSDPLVLFLDEPTSGLDSTSSMELIRALRELATTSGMTIAAVIHQPRFEIFELFHDVLLLGKGGRTVYLGPSEEAIYYFEYIGFKCPSLTNPPDFFMDVINGDVKRDISSSSSYSELHSGNDLFGLWEEYYKDKCDGKFPNGIKEVVLKNRQQQQQQELKEELIITSLNSNNNNGNNSNDNKSDINNQMMEECSHENMTREYKKRTRNWFTQFRMCLRRSFTQQTRDFFGFLLDVSLVFLSGLSVGVIFYNQHYIGPVPELVIQRCPGDLKKKCELPMDDPIISMASIMAMSLGLCGVTASLSTFGTEHTVFIREARSGLSYIAYFLSKNIVQLPQICIAPLIYLSVFYMINTLRANFFEIYYVLILLHFVNYGVGYFLSILIPGPLSQLASVVFVLVQSLLAGSRPTLKQMKDMPFPVPYIPWISYIRYGQEALYILEVKEYSKVFNIETGMDILGYNLDDYWWCIMSVPLFGLLYRFLAYLSLFTLRPDGYFQQFVSYILDVKGWGMKIINLLKRIAKLCCCCVKQRK